MATYEIIIRNGAGDGASVSAPTLESDGKKKKEDGINIKGKAVAAYGIAKRAVTMQISHSVNTVNLRTGHAELQQKEQFMYDLGTRAFNIAESIAMGAILGGGVGGAIVGAVTGLAFQGIQISQQMEERQWRMQEESIGISLANIRAGLGRNVR